MKFEIRNRWTAEIIFECEAVSLRMAVEKAVEARISLRAADLRDADLRDADLRAADLRAADLRDADLRAADLRDADLRDANLRAADLRAADLRDANLRAADLRDADLRAADLRDADLRAADLRDADLRDANLRAANLRAAKDDFFAVLAAAKNEVVGLYQALCDGRVDGSTYEGECACLVGTIANVRHANYRALGEDLRPNADRPAERWFMGIRKGDTPESNPVSGVTKGWIEEWAKENSVALPVRKVTWEMTT
jgi:uncharacterized protein YjbI with pentapeptide repeats